MSRRVVEIRVQTWCGPSSREEPECATVLKTIDGVIVSHSPVRGGPEVDLIMDPDGAIALGDALVRMGRALKADEVEP